MTLFQGSADDPRTDTARLIGVLRLYGAAGDLAIGNPPDFAQRKAALAVALAREAQLDDTACHAVAFAGLLHAVGAIRSHPAAGESPPHRAGAADWDFPAKGARICEGIAALPPSTADFVRWQFENWDGCGFPDQLRWNAIPPGAQLLRAAEIAARATDADEAVVLVTAAAGHEIGPEHAHTFVTWLHRDGGDIPPPRLPAEALDQTRTPARELLGDVARSIGAPDAEPKTPLHIADLAERIAAVLNLTPAQRHALAAAVEMP